MNARGRLAVLAACAIVASIGTAFAVGSSETGPEPDDPSAAAPPHRGTEDARPQDPTTSRTSTRSCDRGESGLRGAPATWVLSNGCALGQRGIPDCGTLMGSSLTYNGDPTGWERSLGDHLGVRRTFYQAGQVEGALDNVRADTAVGRVPWISFKPPYDWRAMVAGRGDAWARDLALQLSQVDGPVWLAIHHEPENDGDITLWTRMQERLAPIIRRTAPNVAYSVILTGWNAFYGRNPAYRLDSLFPRTKIDLLGFDIYNKFGNRHGIDVHTDMQARYFDRIAPWANAHHVAWGLAETGYGDHAARDMPTWISQTYDQVADTGGVAMSYWNSTLGSDTGSDFSLRSSQERRTFAETLRRSPKLKSDTPADDGCSPTAPGDEPAEADQ